MATFIAYGLTDPAGGFAPVTASDELGGALGSDLFVRAATIARANAGAAVLYGDANTTSITLGGGAAQTSVTIGKAGQAINLLGRSAVGGDTSILRSGAATGNEAVWAVERGSTGDDAVLAWIEASSRFDLGFFDTAGGATAPTGALTTFANLKVGSDLTMTGTAIIASTGSIRVTSSGNDNVELRAPNAGYVDLMTVGVGRWRVLGAGAIGSLVAVADNTYDIGATGATRPRTVYARTSLVAQGATNNLTMADGSLTQTGGNLVVVATAGVLQLRSGGANALEFNTNGAVRWNVTSAGHLTTGANDNTLDIGASGTERPRTAYIGTSAVIAAAVTISSTGLASTGAVTVSSTGVLSLDSTTNAIQTNASSITADAALEIVTTTTSALTLDSGTTGTINIGVDGTNAKTLNLDSGTTGGLNVGTSAFAKTITIGNVTGATALVYNAGTGGHAFTGPMGFFGHVVVSQQTNIVSLTDNSGGAANDTIASITNAANAGSADVGPTADAIADLAAKVNGILTILSNLGLMA